MKGNCENCKHETACKKTIGFMFGFCNTDFEPKDTHWRFRCQSPSNPMGDEIWITATSEEDAIAKGFEMALEDPQHNDKGYFAWVLSADGEEGKMIVMQGEFDYDLFSTYPIQ